LLPTAYTRTHVPRQQQAEALVLCGSIMKFDLWTDSMFC
jgi:hypothetical protein